MMFDDCYYMKLAINEGRKGIGRTSPNPAVGAIIVKGDQIIAKGYHKKAGSPHAEINAINKAKVPLDGTTMYVTLEPCSHTGKTPPCCEAIAKTGIKRVVVGMTDPNPLVNGRGIAYLQEKGIEVLSGVLVEACETLNQPFIKYIQTALPYMVMKAGVSLDGRLNYQSGTSGWITGEESGRKVHQLRDEFDAILVGAGTVKSDNPSLTTRLPGKKGRDAVRIILDSRLSTPLSSKVYTQNSSAPAIVFCDKETDEKRQESFIARGVRVIPVSQSENGLDLHEVVQNIGKEGLLSVLVEGGGFVHGSFMREKLYDYAYLFHAPIFAGDGGESLVQNIGIDAVGAAPRISEPFYKKMGEDMLVAGKIIYPE